MVLKHLLNICESVLVWGFISLSNILFYFNISLIIYISTILTLIFFTRIKIKFCSIHGVQNMFINIYYVYFCYQLKKTYIILYVLEIFYHSSRYLIVSDTKSFDKLLL